MVRYWLVLLCVLAARAAPNGRIVGGSDAPNGSIPFIISLRYMEHTCGGNLIHPSWVLTAANCLEGYIPYFFTVVAGITQLNETGTRSPVMGYLTHPEYNPETLENDITLVGLSQPILETDVIKYVSWGCETVTEPINAILAGWGTLVVNGNLSNNLQYLPVATEPNENCKRFTDILEMPLSDRQICAFTTVGEGACNGDAGGPLFVRDNSKDTLIGILSWGLPCALGFPDIYIRVSSYCSWIDYILANYDPNNPK